MENTSFYLKSSENRRIYPPNRYPLIHSIYHQTEEEEFSDFKGFKTKLSIILFLFLIMYQIPRYMQNVFHGPYHLTLQEFIQHVQDLRYNQNKFEYIQVELGENNVESPSSSYETIRQYSDPETRRPSEHIATFKYLKYPEIYVKLPTRHVKQVHAKFPFDFSKFSLETLKCILNTLLSKSTKTFDKKIRVKSDLVEYINAEYSKNSTSFNMLILTKCGILIGYLYKPIYDERAFKPTKEHHLYKNDVIFEASQPYCSYSLILAFIIYIGLIVYGLYYMMAYCIIYIKIKFLSSLPLSIKSDVDEQLQILFKKEALKRYQQLLELDGLILNNEGEFKDQLYIIQDGNEQKFVVILSMERDKIKKCQKLPFQICPILNIRGVNQEGIYYVGDRGREYCIKWPTDSLWKKKEFQKWLHEILIRRSDRYRNIADREVLEKLTREEEDISEKLFKKRNPILARTGTLLQWFRFSRTMNIDLEIFGITDRPVSARLIATFRLYFTRNPKIVDETMQTMTAENGEICAICLYKFDLNERYEIWPGTSTAQHLFHYDCILEQFRTDFKCPLCREPASFN